MPHFFFGPVDGSQPREGASLRTLQDAYVYAIRLAATYAENRPDLLASDTPVHVEVTDVEGQPVFVVTACATAMTNLVLV